MTMGNPPMGIQMGKCLRGALNVPATRKPSCSDLREKMLVIACGFVWKWGYYQNLVPSGNLLHCYWTWPFSSWIYPLKMVDLSIVMLVYQKVISIGKMMINQGDLGAPHFQTHSLVVLSKNDWLMVHQLDEGMEQIAPLKSHLMQVLDWYWQKKLT